MSLLSEMEHSMVVSWDIPSSDMKHKSCTKPKISCKELCTPEHLAVLKDSPVNSFENIVILFSYHSSTTTPCHVVYLWFLISRIWNSLLLRFCKIQMERAVIVLGTNAREIRTLIIISSVKDISCIISHTKLIKVENENRWSWIPQKWLVFVYLTNINIF